jgi:Flp pilus assembly protein protease CpaA
MTWLLIYVFLVSLYDLRTHRIPNGYTIPLIIAGMIAHLPGHVNLWFAGFLLASAWLGGWMGAGDIKLWMAVLWALPDSSTTSLMPLIFMSLFATSLAQISWRTICKQPIGGAKTPAAWRTIPFLLMFWYVH